MTIDEAAAAIAAHLGEVDEDKINNMAYIWFNQVLEALGKRINFESISNLYGNSFAKDANKHIQSANPLLKNGGQKAGSIVDLLGKVKIIQAPSSSDAAKKAVKDQLGDVSWAEGFI